MKYRNLIAILLLCSFIAERNVRDAVLFHSNAEGFPLENWNLKGSGSTHGIADERWTYYFNQFLIDGSPRGAQDVYSEIGKYLRPFFQGLPLTVAIPGAENMIAYYADIPICINFYGLTDSYIAHLPVLSRDRIGHEKKAPWSYLESRHVDFELGHVFLNGPKQLELNVVAFEIPGLDVWLLAKMVTYDSSTMDELWRRFRAAHNKSVLPNYDKLIPYYIKDDLPNQTLDVIENIYASYCQLYFNRYPDSSLQRPFEARIAELKRDSITGK